MEPLKMIREHIRELLEMKGVNCEVSDDASLLQSGLIDSLDVVQIVLFLEQNFGVDFSVRPFDPDEFESIESIHGLLE